MTLQVAGSPNMSEAFEISSCGMLCKQPRCSTQSMASALQDWTACKRSVLLMSRGRYLAGRILDEGCLQ